MVSKSCHDLSGTKLQACQKRAKQELKKKFGTMAEKYLLTWGRTDIDTKVGKVVPTPPQGDWFHKFRKENAEKLYKELKKLKGEPVVLTGGGSVGYDFAFLDEVELVDCDHPPIRTPDGLPIEVPGTNEALRDTRKTECSVQVHIRKFEGKEKRFDPYIGSYRITALHGYGAERLMKKVPRNWEKN